MLGNQAPIQQEKLKSNVESITAQPLQTFFYCHPGMEDGENSPTPNPAPLPPSPPSQDGGVGGSGAGTGTGAGTSQRPSTRVWTRETVPTNLWLPDTVLRMSSCEVEVDGIFSDILNRLQIGGEAGWDTVSQVICLCLCLFFISASFSVSLSNLHFCV